MLKLINVSLKNSKNNTNVLDNVTLEVREGDYVVISGQNEKEQEALLEVLGAVSAPKTGEVYIDGIELTKYTQNQLTIMRRGKFGYLLKCSELDHSLSVGENVEMPLIFAGVPIEEKSAKVERALNIVGLMAFKDLKIDALTAWQKNKVMIARALVGEPKVLVLSEPCRVQDPTKLQEVVGLLSALNRDGVTIVVASNNDVYFSKAKRRLELMSGTITEIKKERAPRETESKKPRAKKTAKSTSGKSAKTKKESLSVPQVVEEVKQENQESVEPEAKKVTKTPRKQKQNSGAEKVANEGKEPAQKKSTRKKKGEVEDANANK